MDATPRGRRIVVPAVCVVALLAVSCGTRAPDPTAPSPLLMPAASPDSTLLGFGQLTTTGAPDLATCLRVPSPACFSATAARHSLRIGTGALSAPINLAGTVVGTTVTLAWTAPAGIVTTYVLEAGSNSGLADLANFSTGNALTTFTATNVPAGTYYARVRAVDSTSTAGPPSNEIVVVVVGGGCVPTGTPTGFGVATNVGGTVGLRWNAASGSPTSYILEAGSAPGLANLANTDVGATTTFTANGVAAGTYYVRVRARNPCGTSGPSNELAIVVSGAAPPPAGVSANIDGVAWTAVSINASFTNGRLSVGGTNPVWSVSFSVFPTGPGTYPVPAAGPSFAFLLSNANPQPGRPVPEWQTSDNPSLGGGGGSITVTSLTATGATGTFSFTLGPYLFTGATGNKSITGGMFNVTFR